MNGSTIVAIFLGTLLSLDRTICVPTGSDKKNSTRGVSNFEYGYRLTINVADNLKESILTTKVKCREVADPIRAGLVCILEDPQYQTIYHVLPCDGSIEPLCDTDHLTVDNSYTGVFGIEYNSSTVDHVIARVPLIHKKTNVYRTIADLLFPGFEVSDKPEGTYSLVEESVYGKCEATIKIVRTRIKTERIKNGTNDEERAEVPKVAFFPVNARANVDPNYREMLSVKSTRNLETCHPIAGLLIINTSFYHPMMTSLHYAVKSSTSRTIVTERTFISYTSENIAMRNIEEPYENATTLHVRTTLTLHSSEPTEEPVPTSLQGGVFISTDFPFHSIFSTEIRHPSENNLERHETSTKRESE